jgi:putative FmdB family regulatory protein
MPTYEYVCTECGKQLEVVQSFKDDALTECPACSGRLRKIFGNVGVSFKGSGFYKTDSRGSAGAKSPSSEAKSTETPSTETKASEAKTETKSESKPAESKPSDSKAS